MPTLASALAIQAQSQAMIGMPQIVLQREQHRRTEQYGLIKCLLTPGVSHGRSQNKQFSYSSNEL